ncbi:MBL fold metallo-hydrolase [Sphingomicrobium astaxanthinifaciens]|uniref:MBL fold metallo-hydrolase n=1 Tax=Sphingomicrobium astaxanthinifaciens TaxID=1227949 RepID=UPI001FCB8346|nr:MBL fold metallo-hydrolase [Sphingomicrobium astaxanthinifaciens]MCJ7422398.1 MBL fold metallo-hydrolase [Sphingomicrobium astaxanthinifaciens]
MKIRVLGCGTSGGVPHVDGNWGACDPANAKNRRRRSSILVEAGEGRLLVDCGPDCREQLLDAGVRGLDACIVTHDHADHCHGIDDLRGLVRRSGRRLPLWARAHTLDQLERRFAYAFAGYENYSPLFEPVALDSERAWQGGRFRFVDQPHGSINSLGLRFDRDGKSLAYAIDFHELTSEMATLYAGVDVWICDCLGLKPHPTHAHLDAVLRWAKELGVGQLWLTHLDIVMDHAQLSSMLPDWAAPCHDGLELTL